QSVDAVLRQERGEFLRRGRREVRGMVRGSVGSGHGGAERRGGRPSPRTGGRRKKVQPPSAGQGRRAESVRPIRDQPAAGGASTDSSGRSVRRPFSASQAGFERREAYLRPVSHSIVTIVWPGPFSTASRT